MEEMLDGQYLVPSDVINSHIEEKRELEQLQKQLVVKNDQLVACQGHIVKLEAKLKTFTIVNTHVEETDVSQSVHDESINGAFVGEVNEVENGPSLQDELMQLGQNQPGIMEATQGLSLKDQVKGQMSDEDEITFNQSKQLLDSTHLDKIDQSLKLYKQSESFALLTEIKQERIDQEFSDREIIVDLEIQLQNEKLESNGLKEEITVLNRELCETKERLAIIQSKLASVELEQASGQSEQVSDQSEQVSDQSEQGSDQSEQVSDQSKLTKVQSEKVIEYSDIEKGQVDKLTHEISMLKTQVAEYEKILMEKKARKWSDPANTTVGSAVNETQVRFLFFIAYYFLSVFLLGVKICFYQ